MIDLRDGISDELNTRVSLKVRWILWIILACLILGAIGFARLKHVTQSESTKITTQIENEYNVRRHFDGSAWGTFWDYCGVTLTADHVPSSMPDNGEGFIGKPVHRSDGLIDAAWYGRKWTCGTPTKLEKSMGVYIVGYPAGSSRPALRFGTVYLHRGASGSPGYEMATWIVKIEQVEEPASEPVVDGMSGGIVVNHSFQPVGILVTQNSPADIDGDGQFDQSADIVSLHDAYSALIR